MGRSAEFFAAGTAAVVLLGGCNADAAIENPNSGLHPQTVDFGPSTEPVDESDALLPPVTVQEKDNNADKNNKSFGSGNYEIWENPGPNDVPLIDVKSLTGLLTETSPNELAVLRKGDRMEVVCYTAGGTALIGVYVPESVQDEFGLAHNGFGVWASAELTRQLREDENKLDECKD